MPAYQFLLSAYRRTPGIVRELFRVAGLISRVRPPDWIWRAAMLTIPACDRVALSERLTMMSSSPAKAASIADSPRCSSRPEAASSGSLAGVESLAEMPRGRDREDEHRRCGPRVR